MPLPSSVILLKFILVIFPSTSLIYTSAPVKLTPVESDVITIGVLGTELIMPLPGTSLISICFSNFPSCKLITSKLEPKPA